MEKIFSRDKVRNLLKEHQIFCKDPRIVILINEWLYKTGWDYKDFIDFFKFMGIETPVLLNQYIPELNLFYCVSKHNKQKIGICLHDESKKEEHNSKILITKSNEEVWYSIKRASKTKEKRPRKIWKNKRKFVKGRKPFTEFHYSKNLFACRIGFGNITLKIKISEPDKLHGKITEENSSILNPNIQEDIENYLLNLNADYSLNEVAENVMDIFNFKDKKLKNVKKMIFETVKNTSKDKEECIIERIVYKYGVRKE